MQDIAATYPFHPRLKNVIALFKENEHFKQTRGLIELVSRLLKSAWESPANDVFLIGVPVASVQETTIRGLTGETVEENEGLHPRLSWMTSANFSGN
jgi:predicted AAA+ superfamily ATPase